MSPAQASHELDSFTPVEQIECEQLLPPRLERFIGVIYRPESERWSHYSECSLPQQFDGYIWFDRTTAVTPLPTRTRPGEDETYPFGL